MEWKLQGPSLLLKAIRQNFFLRKHRPEPETIHVLKRIYPNLNWDRVEFYEGLPWFTPIVAPYVNAQALPAFYSFRKFRIYLRKFDESRAQCVADIVHEAFHIMQAMQFAKGYGLGFFRGWLFYYIAHFLQEGYRGNVFEIPAYDQEFLFLRTCEKHGLHGIMPRIDAEKLIALGTEKDLIHTRFKYAYKRKWAFLPLSFLICLIVAVSKPVMDCLFFLVLWPRPKQNSETTRPLSTN